MGFQLASWGVVTGFTTNVGVGLGHCAYSCLHAVATACTHHGRPWGVPAWDACSVSSVGPSQLCYPRFLEGPDRSWGCVGLCRAGPELLLSWELLQGPETAACFQHPYLKPGSDASAPKRLVLPRLLPAMLQGSRAIASVIVAETPAPGVPAVFLWGSGYFYTPWGPRPRTCHPSASLWAALAPKALAVISPLSSLDSRIVLGP